MQAAWSKVTSNLGISIQSGIKEGQLKPLQKCMCFKTQALKGWGNESYLKQGYDPERIKREGGKQKGKE